ncbi:MAG TPA: lipopolysaccharide biosynthesis protein, partial [Flavobacteriia bacterium]|nr:lipopolysaccharide biosynthesis protein [Flavobacteriia bacterium]
LPFCFLQDEYYGLVTFLLSSAAVLLPILIFGMQATVIKYFSGYATKIEQDQFLTMSLFLPLLVILPVGIFGFFFYDYLSEVISQKNPMIKNYAYLIFLVAVFMGYFELFYAWSKVQLQSVFGNFIKEVFHRVAVTILLFLVFFKILNQGQFIYAVVVVYALRMLIMLFYSLYLYQPKLKFSRHFKTKQLFRYAFYIVLSASAGGILLEIDKFMIPQIETGLAKVAYYSVAVYIASVISIPARAMLQIATPITAKELNKGHTNEVQKLYSTSSIHLLIIGGLLFLLINLNVSDLYKIINKPEYATGIFVVFLISLSELFKLALGTNTAILSNSKYYKIYFYFSFLMSFSVIVLNDLLIKKYGTNGAAISTLIVVVVYGLIRLWYVNNKLKMQPFTIKTAIILGLIFILYFVFYYISFSFQPLFNIIIKSIIIGIIYISIVYFLKISTEFNQLLHKIIKKKHA